MRYLSRLLVILAASLFVLPFANAAEEGKEPENHDWSFEGPFGRFDQIQLQRGYLVFEQVCAACHALDYMSFRNLGEPGGPFYSDEYPNANDNPIVRSIAANYIITDGPDEFGDMIERPGRPADAFPQPYDNPQQAAAANGGAVPPNLSLIVKARSGGADYIRSLLLGYTDDVPYDVDLRPGQYYNEYFPGGVLAMPPQLQEGLVDYADGTEASVEQMAEDVTAFLAWAGEPHHDKRKEMGLMVMIYLLGLSILLWLAYRQVWSRIEH